MDTCFTMANQQHSTALYTQLDQILNSKKYEQLHSAHKTQSTSPRTILTGSGWLVLYLGKCPSFLVNIEILDNHFILLSDIDEYYKTRAMFLMNDLMLQLTQDPTSTTLVKILPHFLEVDCKIFWEQNFASFLERNFGFEFAEPGGIWRIRQITAEICRIC